MSTLYKGLFLSTVVAAASAVASPANADDGDKAKTIWNPPAKEVSKLLQNGWKVCYGDKKLYDCSIYNPWKERVLSDVVVRPKGNNQNQAHLEAVMTERTGDGQLEVARDDLGNARYETRSGTQNANAGATLTAGLAQVPGAFVNGMGAAVVNAVSNPCRNGGCGQQGPAIVNQNYNQAGSQSQSASQSGVVADISVAAVPTPCSTQCVPLPYNPDGH